MPRPYVKKVGFLPYSQKSDQLEKLVWGPLLIAADGEKKFYIIDTWLVYMANRAWLRAMERR
jgi:hypothetical protein